MNEKGSASGFSHVLRALKYRNYRLFFFGQSISLLGSWMQSIAIAWLTFRLTDHSPFWLGFLGFASQVPAFFLAPIGGIAADRWNRQKTLLITQSLAMIQATLLAILYFTGLINIGHIIALTIFMGVIMAFDIPILL